MKRWHALRAILGRRTVIMGVVNVTSDSFSGDGLGDDIDAAVEQGRRFLAEGAEILDVGGESTRPGHTPLGVTIELRRVVPVVERLALELDALVSIDTRKPEVARAAVRAGAEIVNDVTGLRNDPDIADVVAEHGVGLVLQHWHVREHTDTLRWVIEDLRWSVDRALRASVPQEDIIIDPGLGFGKEHSESMELVRRLRELREALPYAVLLGPSRKRFIGMALGGAPVEERMEGTIGASIVGLMNGADIIRVHDVAAVSRAARVADAILGRAPRDPA